MRKFIFAGVDTLQAGFRINSERSTTTGGEQRTNEDSIPFGSVLITPVGLNAANLTYCLIVRGENRAELAAKARNLVETFTDRKGDLIDSDLAGKKYTNAVFINAEPLEYVSRNFTTAYLAVNFRADPVPVDINAVNERVLKFTDRLTGANTATIAVNDSAYTLTTSGGTTATGTLPTGERKYRITAYSEQIPTITLGGASVQVDAVFTLPASGTITISGAGYGYFELWHDTREVRL